jgi:hypothetical protein
VIRSTVASNQIPKPIPTSRPMPTNTPAPNQVNKFNLKINSSVFL